MISGPDYGLTKYFPRSIERLKPPKGCLSHLFGGFMQTHLVSYRDDCMYVTFANDLKSCQTNPVTNGIAI